MIPRSKVSLALLVVLPLALMVWMARLAQKRPHFAGSLSAPAASLALSGDGRQIAVSRQDGRVELIGAGDRRFRSLPVEDVRGVNANGAVTVVPQLRFSPDGATLLGSNIRVSKDNTAAVYEWQVAAPKVAWSIISSFKEKPSVVSPDQFVFSPDGKRLAHCTYNVVKVLDVSGAGTPKISKKSRFARDFPLVSRFTSQNVGKGNGPTVAKTNILIAALAWSPDSASVILVESSGRLQFWNGASGQKTSQTPPPPGVSPSGSSWTVAVSPDGRFVAIFEGNIVSVWNNAARKWTTSHVTPLPSSDVSLAWMPDSRSLWTGSGSVQQWNVPGLKLMRELPIDGPVAVSGDGKTLATRSLPANGVMGVWTWNIG